MNLRNNIHQNRCFTSNSARPNGYFLSPLIGQNCIPCLLIGWDWSIPISTLFWICQELLTWSGSHTAIFLLKLHQGLAFSVCLNNSSCSKDEARVSLLRIEEAMNAQLWLWWHPMTLVTRSFRQPVWGLTNQRPCYPIRDDPRLWELRGVGSWKYYPSETAAADKEHTNYLLTAAAYSIECQC